MAGNWWEDDYTPPPFDVGTTPGVGYNDLFGPGTQPGLGPGYGNDDYFNPYENDYPPSYFPPADTGTIIGNTPGIGPLPDNPYTFRGTPTYGTPPPSGNFPPRDTGDLLRGTPGVSGRDLGGAPFNWGKLGRNLLNILGPQQGRPGGQGPGGVAGMLPAIARILQGLSQGRAQGRMTEAEMARLYDYLNLARTRTFYDRAGAELDQRKFGQDLQERSFSNANRAAFLQNYPSAPGSRAPAAITPFMGTARPGIEGIPQDRRNEIGGAMYRNAITELLDPLQPGTATSGRRMAALPEPEPISPTPEAGRFDDVLNWASIIMGGLYPTQQTTTTTTTNPPANQPRSAAATPPEAIPPRRSTDTTSGTGPRPSYTGDAIVPQTTQALSTPAPLSQYAPSPAQTAASADLGLSARLPAIAGLVPEVPRPTAPLTPYDPYGRLDRYGRPMAGRA